MQYVACKFRPTDTRSFTYSYDLDEPIAVGDFVKVPDRSGEGWKRVQVASISDEAPPFPCKPILGIYNPNAEPDAEGDAAAQPDASGDPLDAEIPW